MSFFDIFLPTKKWHLRNEETGEILQGQFAPQQLTREVKNNWARHTALGRGNPVTQFLNSAADTLSFQGMFWADDATVSWKVRERIDLLISWARIDSDLGRPPRVTFWVGDEHVEQLSVIDSIGSITYGEQTITGEIRQVTFTLNLVQYVEFDLNDSEATDTRYHRSRERDYYEMLTWREYGSALLGDVIRKRHPDKPTLVAGTIVKLPAIAGIRTEKVEPTSLALQTITGRASTPQKTLRDELFEQRNVRLVSHIVVE